ncbi:MAG: lysophospholipid acyltransferase family protein [Rhodobacteraceae bacterium]|nr:lysophospholipid acyltransferase family protein [Paracoccaceae bacterium]
MPPSLASPPRGGAAEDISYAGSARTRAGRAVIRAAERATGRAALLARARGYEDDIASGADFWEVMLERFGLRLELLPGSAPNLPEAGPLIVVANHPFGILDGLAMGALLSRARGRFRILAHRVFCRAAELEETILPVSFDETPDAIRLNIATRRAALGWLGQGGALCIFPGGTVSTAARPFGLPLDPGWRGFTARMVQKSGATVAPVFFEGRNSRLFQIASHLHPTLRMACLIAEFRRRVDTPVRLCIGKPLAREVLSRYDGDARGLMACLRHETYRLSPRPVPPGMLGLELEEKHRVRWPSASSIQGSAG